MKLWLASLLGIVQGLTEFIPVSSTAHLRIIPALLGQADPGAAFTAVIQLGTLIAVIVYFRRELTDMVRAFFSARNLTSSRDARLALYLVCGTIPIGIAGVLFKSVVTGSARSLYVVAAALIVVAVIMWLADNRSRQTRMMTDLRLSDALLIGAAQACALIPGVSRSGATIAMALMIGLRRDESARFSFLLSIPAIAAAGVFELPDAFRELGSAATLAILVATVLSFLSGYASIAWLIRFLKTRTLSSLVIYRLSLGMLIVGLLVTHVLSPR